MVCTHIFTFSWVYVYLRLLIKYAYISHFLVLHIHFHSWLFFHTPRRVTGKDDRVSFTELLAIESHLKDVCHTLLDQKVKYASFSYYGKCCCNSQPLCLTLPEEDKARRRWMAVQAGQGFIIHKLAVFFNCSIFFSFSFWGASVLPFPFSNLTRKLILVLFISLKFHADLASLKLSYFFFPSLFVFGLPRYLDIWHRLQTLRFCRRRKQRMMVQGEGFWFPSNSLPAGKPFAKKNEIFLLVVGFG